MNVNSLIIPSVVEESPKFNVKIMYYVYILTNKHNTVLYIGMTRNLERRVSEHYFKINRSFTEKYNVYKLIYFEIYPDWRSAFNRERQLKRWSRVKKEKLILGLNPGWVDLIEREQG